MVIALLHGSALYTNNDDEFKNIVDSAFFNEINCMYKIL